MKKAFKCLIALVLALVLAFPLASCKKKDGTPPDGTSVLARAKELTEALGSVPTAASLCGLEKEGGATPTSLVPETSHGGMMLLSSAALNITNPKYNQEYQHVLAERDGRSCDQYYAQIVNSDYYVREVQKLREAAVSSITQLDTWIDMKGSPVHTDIQRMRMRLSYDAQRDVVILDALHGTNNALYYHVEATYTPEKKAVVNAYFVELQGNSVYSKIAIHFEEGVYHAVSCDSNRGSGTEYDFLCYADLTSASRDTIVFNATGSARFSRIGENSCYIQREGSMSLMYLEDEQSNTVGTLQLDRALIDNGSGEPMLFDYVHFAIDMYFLDGLYSITQKEDVFKAYIFDEEWDRARDIAGTLDTEDYSATLSVECTTNNSASTYRYPQLRISINPADNGSMTQLQTLEAVLAHYGLSVKGAHLQRQVALAADFDTYYRSFDFVKDGGEGAMSADWAKAKADYYMSTTPTAEEILAMASAKALPFQSQTPTESYFKIFGATLSGNATVNADTLLIDLSTLSVAVDGSAVMTPNAEYAIFLALGNGTEQTVLTRATTPYTDGALTCTGLTSFDPTALPEGDYTLRVFFGQPNGDSFTRMSEAFTVPAAQTGVYEKTLENTVITVTAAANGIRISVKPPAEENQNQ